MWDREKIDRFIGNAALMIMGLTVAGMLAYMTWRAFT